MSKALELLIRRNLFSVFGERDPEERGRVMEEIWKADGIFIDPDGPRVGLEAIDQAIVQLHANLPGFVFTELGAVEAFHGIGRVVWGFGPPGLPPVVTGQDVVVAEGGRIRALYTFVDSMGK
jgi:hypothetical protein